MSRLYKTVATLTIGRLEEDFHVRAFVTVAPGLGMGGGIGAKIDGDVEVLVSAGWLSLEDVGAEEIQRTTERLLEMALEDDSSECVEAAE